MGERRRVRRSPRSRGSRVALAVSAAVPSMAQGILLGWVMYGDASQWWLVTVAVLMAVALWQSWLAVGAAYEVGRIEGWRERRGL